jgi:hypothetical protein
MNIVKCPICNQEIKTSGIGIHFKIKHNLNYKKYAQENNLEMFRPSKQKKEIIYDENSNYICEYGCNTIATYKLKSGKWCCCKSCNSCDAIKQKNSKSNKGKVKQESPFLNKKNRYDWTNKQLSKEHKEKISIANMGNKIYHNLSDDKKNEMKQKLRNNMMIKYQNGFEVKCGRAPKYSYESPIAGNIKVDGSWELKVAKYFDTLNINWIRNKKRFNYINELGKYATYCPDFYIIDFDCYIEVKGYKIKKDECKWSQFTENLQVWEKSKLKELDII